MYYFEYPSLVAMLVREIKYGVELGLEAVKIDPFGAPAAFQYHTGDINVALDPASVSYVSVPGSGLFPFTLQRMSPSATYLVATAAGCSTAWSGLQAQADADGKLAFSAPRGTDCALVITKL